MAIWWLDRSGLGLLGLVPAGLGFAATFPVVISLVPDYVGERRAAQVIGWCVAFAAIGGPSGTALGGVIANGAGLAAVPPLFTAVTAALVAAVVVLPRVASPSG